MQPDTRKGFIHFNRQNLKIIDIDNTIFLHILDITYHLILPAKKILSPKKIKIIGRNYILEKFIVTTRISWHLARVSSCFPWMFTRDLVAYVQFHLRGGLLGTSTTGVKIRREAFSPPCDKFTGLKEAPRYRQNPEEHVERILFSLPLFSSLVSLAFSRGRKGGNWVPAQIAASCIFRIARKRGKGRRDERQRSCDRGQVSVHDALNNARPISGLISRSSLCICRLRWIKRGIIYEL